MKTSPSTVLAALAAFDGNENFERFVEKLADAGSIDAATLLGFIEGSGDVGMTYDDPDSARSAAYDAGRAERKGLFGA